MENNIKMTKIWRGNNVDCINLTLDEVQRRAHVNMVMNIVVL
jgi:hypothetical protein